MSPKNVVIKYRVKIDLSKHEYLENHALDRHFYKETSIYSNK